MNIKDRIWAIVDTDCGVKKPAPIFLDWACARTRRQCIEQFEKKYDKSWAEMKKLGYRCVRFAVEGSVKL
jgi:hypothetical protein